MVKICIYTCITNGYDSLEEPLVQDNAEYICFTDNTAMKSRIWKIFPIPSELRHLSAVKQQRILKICPHRYLKQFDNSLWLDGNIRICRSLDPFFQQYDLKKHSLYVRIHPARNCIYKEAQAVIEHNKADVTVVQHQIDKYRNERYPKEIGLAETGILLRNHLDRKCIMLCNAWAEEVLMHSHRDQISFNYACWKQKFIPGYLTNEFHANNTFFTLSPHLDK